MYALMDHPPHRPYNVANEDLDKPSEQNPPQDNGEEDVLYVESKPDC